MALATAAVYRRPASRWHRRSAAVGTAGRYLAATPAERQWRLAGIHWCPTRRCRRHRRSLLLSSRVLSGGGPLGVRLQPVEVVVSCDTRFSVLARLPRVADHLVLQRRGVDREVRHPRPSYSECSRTASTAGWARTAPQRLDLRGLPATNRPRDDEAPAGRFRKDLLYRLNVFGREAPPLRDTCCSPVTVTVPDETGAEERSRLRRLRAGGGSDSALQRGSTGDDQITQDRGHWSPNPPPPPAGMDRFPREPQSWGPDVPRARRERPWPARRPERSGAWSPGRR